jgi:hypothetical protein
MIVMSIYAVVGIGAEAVLPLGVQARRVLEIADQVLCAVFFLDFIWTMRATENKARYFFTWGWISFQAFQRSDFYGLPGWYALLEYCACCVVCAGLES